MMNAVHSTDQTKKFWAFFLSTAKPYRWWFFAMLLVGIYASIHSVLQPYILKVLLDGVARTSPINVTGR